MNGDTESRLDALLAAPLSNVADDGFSARFMGRIEREGRLSWVEKAALAAVAVLLLLVVPFQALADAMVKLSEDAANSVPLAAATLAIALSMFWLRVVAED